MTLCFSLIAINKIINVSTFFISLESHSKGFMMIQYNSVIQSISADSNCSNILLFIISSEILKFTLNVVEKSPGRIEFPECLELNQHSRESIELFYWILSRIYIHSDIIIFMMRDKLANT